MGNIDACHTCAHAHVHTYVYIYMHILGLQTILYYTIYIHGYIAHLIGSGLNRKGNFLCFTENLSKF